MFVSRITSEAQIDNPASDIPIPQITFTTQDALSGISRAVLFVDSKEILNVGTTTTVALPPQAPGIHTLLVKFLSS